nr:hypothetical protein [Cylindrospermopsis raciborskii]
MIIYSIHQNHWRMIHDLPWSEKPVFLKINRLKSVQSVSPTLAKMHCLKEKFREIFERCTNWGDSIIDLLEKFSY